MSQEPIITTAVVEPSIVESMDHAQRPAPSVEEQQVADDVFSTETQKLAATVLNLQAGIAIAHHLFAETFQRASERPEEEPRKKPRLKE